LLIAANEEKADVFDFGLGDEAFKSRFANRIEHVFTFGMYLSKAVGHNNLLEEK
jgi:CelD/BcsL family acetyltransferase involved in cellulose biosynthesis